MISPASLAADTAVFKRELERSWSITFMINHPGGIIAIGYRRGAGDTEK
jgi:hypothetical protein